MFVMGALKDITNQIFGKLTVVERVENDKDGHAQGVVSQWLPLEFSL